MSGRASSTIQTNDYNANKVLYDYLEINNSAVMTIDTLPTYILREVTIIQPPTQLDLSVEDTIKVYINGIKYSKN